MHPGAHYYVLFVLVKRQLLLSGEFFVIYHLESLAMHSAGHCQDRDIQAAQGRAQGTFFDEMVL